MRKKIRLSQAKFWSKAMSNGWTPERKTKHSVAIHNWKPWLKATGPKTAEGKAIVARNAFKGRRRPALRREMTRIRAALQILRFHDSVSDHK